MAPDYHRLSERLRPVLDGLAGVLGDSLPPPIRELLQRAREDVLEAQELLRERAAQQDSGGAGGDWYVTAEALEQWRRFRAWRQASRRQALSALLELCTHATLRQTDAHGREMWRVPDRLGGLRMIVDPRPQSGLADELPRLLWVGASRPPRWCWEPAADR